MLSREYTESQDPLGWLRETMSVSREQIEQVSGATVGQRENSLWAAVRKLRFTASNFGQILGAARRHRLTDSLKKRLMSTYNMDRAASIQWGITHEDEAIAEFCQLGVSVVVSVARTGIWLHKSEVLAVLPDGIIKKPSPAVEAVVNLSGTCFSLLLKVKCPYSARDMLITEAVASVKDFFLGVCDGDLFLKTNHNYWH